MAIYQKGNIKLYDNRFNKSLGKSLTETELIKQFSSKINKNIKLVNPYKW